MYMLLNCTIFSRSTNGIELNYQNNADITKVKYCKMSTASSGFPGGIILFSLKFAVYLVELHNALHLPYLDM